jgi:hypothetical protein
MSWKRIIIHGIVDIRFYVSNDYIWERRRHSKGKCRWQLPYDTNGDDIVVCMPEVLGSGIEQELLGDPCHERSELSIDCTSGGLWLLRSVGNDEHRIIVCLSQQQIEDDRYRPLAVDLGNAAIGHSTKAPWVLNWNRRQKFTIV